MNGQTVAWVLLIGGGLGLGRWILGRTVYRSLDGFERQTANALESCDRRRSL